MCEVILRTVGLLTEQKGCTEAAETRFLSFFYGFCGSWSR